MALIIPIWWRFDSYFITLDYDHEVSITCWVLGDQVKEHFLINIRSDAKVKDLKELVREKLQSKYNLEARSVWLYSIPHPDPQDNMKGIVAEVLNENGNGVQLSENQRILEAFFDLPFNKAHFVVVEELFPDST